MFILLIPQKFGMKRAGECFVIKMKKAELAQFIVFMSGLAKSYFLVLIKKVPNHGQNKYS